MKISLTSVMLPKWDLETTFAKLAEHGYDGIELRCRYNPDDPNAELSNWGRHLTDVSPDNITEKAGQIRELSEKTGVRVCALAPNFVYDQTDIIEKIFKGALAIDSENPPLIRIGAQRHDRTQPYISQYLKARAGFATLVEIARDHGVKVIYEIHVGTIAVSASRTIELLEDFDPNHIGAIWDVPNMIRVGLEDSKMGLELLGPYLSHVHIGNATPVQTERDDNGQMLWKWDFSDLREGMANIPQIIQDLKDVGYTGYMSLEEFGPGDDDTKIGEQGAYLKKLITG
ncbi:MAG: sugar phosphate isomerase/epimerase [Candidatus Latescibacteria bacterium]|nr:sugar phosphate isomerase/epimerase [Candidatus Latescibacterota bacterium]